MYKINQVLMNSISNDEISIEEAINKNKDAICDILDDTVAFVKSEELALTAQEAYLKEQIASIKAKKEKLAFLQESVIFKMREFGFEKIDSKHFKTLALANAGGVQAMQVDDDLDLDKLPEAYTLIKPAEKILNKDAVKKALSGGENLDFARLLPRKIVLKMGL
jgi:Siphovirus Gp157